MMQSAFREHASDDERAGRGVCPLCQSRERHAFRTVVRQGGAYDLARCAHCRFVYVTDPRIDTANHAAEAELVWRFRRRHHQTRQLLMQVLPDHSRIVEIGCGRGELGYIMRRDPYEYVGYEPASGLSDFGRKHGVNVIADYFAPGKEARAGAVVIDNVLEHVLDPQDLFGAAVESLRPGGVIVVIVPNRLDIRQLSPAWRRRNLWIPPDHINYFAKSDLRRLFRRFGLKLRPFGFRPLTPQDFRYYPRASLEVLGIPVLGHNVYAVREK